MASNVISIAVTSQTGGLRRGLKDAQGSLHGFNKSTKGATLGLATLVKGYAGLAAAGKAGQFLKGSINEARDLSETVSKSKQIFGAQASVMDKWSNGAAHAFGLSKSEALAAAASYGDMFTQLGFTGKAAASTSQDVVKMAADLGSFNNLDTGDVLERISGAFRGEYDSLQKVIPNISAARVEKEALAASGKKLASSLTAEEKATAVLAIMQKDGKKATGDFARTSDGLANRQKILAARSKDLQAKLGKALLPAVNALTLGGIKLVDGLTGMGSKVQAVKGFFSKYGTAIKVTAGVLTAIFLPAMIQAGAAFVAQAARAVALNAAWLVYGITVKATSVVTKAFAAAQWLMNAAMSANPIALVVIGLVALGAGLILAYKKSATFRAIVQGAFKGVQAAGKALWSAIKVAFNGIKIAIQVAGKAISLYLLPAKTAFKLLVAGAKAIIPGVKSAFNSAVAFIKGIPGKIKDAFSGAKTLLTGIGGHIVDGLANGIRNAAGKVMDAVSGLVSKIPKKIRGIMGIRSPSKVTTRLGRYIGQGLRIGIDLETSGVVKAVSKQGLKTKAQYAKNNRAIMKGLVAAAKARLNALKAQSREYAAAVASSAKSYAGLSNIQLGENENLSAAYVKKYLTDRLAAIKNFNAKLAALKKKGISSDLYNQIVQMGVEQGTGFAEALATASPAALKELNSLQSQIGTASNALGNNTSKAMYGNGINAAKGFYNGLRSYAKKIASAGGSIGKALIRSVKKALGIRSPSRVFAGIGVQTLAGLDRGLDTRVVKAKGAELSRALIRGYASPQMDAQLSAGFRAEIEPPSRKSGDVTYNITVQLDSSMTVEQMGVQYKKAIKAAERIGL